MEKAIAVGPLSFAQQRLWFIQELTSGTAAYNISAAAELQGALDHDALRTALTEVVRRHESLRTAFVADGGRPLAVVLPPTPFELPLINVHETAGMQADVELRRLVREVTTTRFALDQGTPMRAKLFAAGPHRHVLTIALHHIVADAWSVGILIRELVTLYDAFAARRPSPLPDLPIQYRDFVVWQRNRLTEERLIKQRQFWEQHLLGLRPSLLPTDLSRPSSLSYRGDTVPLSLGRSETDKLRALALAEGATLFMVLLAGFHAVLARCSGECDVAVGTLVGGRGSRESERLIGLFLNTIIVRADLSGDPTISEIIRRVRTVTVDALTNQDLPFELLVESMNPERDLSRHPLFQVAFVFNTVGLPEVTVRGLSVRSFPLESQASKFDAMLDLCERDGAVGGSLEYSSDLFARSTALRLATYIANFWRAMANNPDQRLSVVSMVPEAERRAVISDFNRTEQPFENAPVHEYFERHASDTPELPAVVAEGATLTYGELDARSRVLADFLSMRGVGREGRVGVLADSSPEMVVALLAILRAGGVYVPLDPADPTDRLKRVMRDAQPVLILGHRQYQTLVDDVAPFVAFDEAAVTDVSPNAGRRGEIAPARLAYIIYTSGSTGQPKGAMNTHGALTNRLQWMRRQYRLGPADRVLHKTSIGFDVSVWELLLPLICGATLVVSRSNGRRDPRYLVDLIIRKGVTITHFVPSALDVFLDEPGVDHCATLRHVICSGEALKPELARKCLSRLSAGLHNLYGPTEAAIDVTAFDCRAGFERRFVSIGRPIDNTSVYVLDRGMQPVPLGAIGELHIGGVCLARGYNGRTDLTAGKFVPDPFSARSGERLYKTGDLVRLHENGHLEFVSRNDHQIKIRGHRVELGEIETAILAHPDVRESVAVYEASDSSSGGRLVAYVVRRSPSGLSEPQLRAFLETMLPAYMVPSQMMFLSDVAKTASGKINRSALPKIVAQLEQEYVAPESEVEQRLGALWQECLSLKRVGAHDDFFQLGGHSLMAARLASRINEEFGVEVPIEEIFRHPRLRALARAIEQVRDKGATPDRQSALERDAMLDGAVQPDRARVRGERPTRIVLTGGTGYVGVFLLRELLRHTDATIVCLVRSGDDASAMRRVERSLRQFGLWEDAFGGRIAALPADLCQPLLGLPPELYREMARTTDRVYHAAARVSFIQPYEALKTDNVDGTVEVIRFACSELSKPLHLVSTISVIPPSARARAIDEDESAGPHGLDTGYAESKWVAEQLVRCAIARGLPAVIYRPSMVVGDHKHGRWNPNDFLAQLIRLCVSMRCIPDITVPLNLVPVDYVAAAITHLSSFDRFHGRTFHLVNTEEVIPRDLAAALRKDGLEVPLLAYSDWRARLEYLAATESSGFAHVALALLPPLPTQGDNAAPPTARLASRYGYRTTQDALQSSGFKHAAVDLRSAYVPLRRLVAAEIAAISPSSS